MTAGRGRGRGGGGVHDRTRRASSGEAFKAQSSAWLLFFFRLQQYMTYCSPYPALLLVQYHTQEDPYLHLIPRVQCQYDSRVLLLLQYQDYSRVLRVLVLLLHAAPVVLLDVPNRYHRYLVSIRTAQDPKNKRDRDLNYETCVFFVIQQYDTTGRLANTA